MPVALLLPSLKKFAKGIEKGKRHLSAKISIYSATFICTYTKKETRVAERQLHCIGYKQSSEFKLKRCRRQIVLDKTIPVSGAGHRVWLIICATSAWCFFKVKISLTLIVQQLVVITGAIITNERTCSGLCGHAHNVTSILKSQWFRRHIQKDCCWLHSKKNNPITFKNTLFSIFLQWKNVFLILINWTVRKIFRKLMTS